MINRPASPETRLWQLAAMQAQEIEQAWDNPPQRERLIIACRQWLEKQDHLPQLARLARLLEPQMERRQLWSLLVPLERAAGRERVTDTTILSSDTPAATPSTFPVTVVADNIRSAFNTGGFFRTADCFGASDIWLCGYSATPEHPQVAAAAMDSHRHIPWQTFDRVADAVDKLHRSNVFTVAIETVADAPAIDEIPWHFPCAILFGNERFGLDPQTITSCRAVARIPTYGYKNSLNVVSALAVTLWSARCSYNR
ncbi:MAG: RNA methyltransferase [Lentisphaerae bacterium]|jgi:tRNA G18 (ribose-2'-O)-methylase SpoU|nr:RNA methyltransferase [Lentisphaerota bacterium]